VLPRSKMFVGSTHEHFRFALTPAAQQETRELGGDRCHDTNKVLATVGQWVVAG